MPDLKDSTLLRELRLQVHRLMTAQAVLLQWKARHQARFHKTSLRAAAHRLLQRQEPATILSVGIMMKLVQKATAKKM